MEIDRPGKKGSKRQVTDNKVRSTGDITKTTFPEGADWQGPCKGRQLEWG
jgi:hypothetical protein